MWYHLPDPHLSRSPGSYHVTQSKCGSRDIRLVKIKWIGLPATTIIAHYYKLKTHVVKTCLGKMANIIQTDSIQYSDVHILTWMVMGLILLNGQYILVLAAVLAWGHVHVSSITTCVGLMTLKSGESIISVTGSWHLTKKWNWHHLIISVLCNIQILLKVKQIVKFMLVM